MHILHGCPTPPYCFAFQRDPVLLDELVNSMTTSTACLYATHPSFTIQHPWNPLPKLNSLTKRSTISSTLHAPVTSKHSNLSRRRRTPPLLTSSPTPSTPPQATLSCISAPPTDTLVHPQHPFPPPSMHRAHQFINQLNPLHRRPIMAPFRNAYREPHPRARKPGR